MPANVHSDTHISQIHMPVHTGTKHTHTQMHARIRGSHGGWCAALCSRIGSSASCELDSPGSVLIPAALFWSSHIHTHTPVPAPAQQRVLLSLFCLFAPVFLYFFLFFFPRLHPALSFPVLWSQIGKATVRTAQRNLCFNTCQIGMHGRICVFAYIIVLIVSTVSWDLCASFVVWTRRMSAKPKIFH